MDADDPIIGMSDGAPMPPLKPTMNDQIEDPELEAENAIVAKYGHMAQAMLDDAVRYGYRAALRSLGAGTPEAVAALRELVKASLKAQEAFDFYAAQPFESDEGCFRANSTEDVRKLAVIAYRALVTPPKK